jgi:hypothetical protein
MIITRGWHNRPIGGRSTDWTQLDFTPPIPIKKKSCVTCPETLDRDQIPSLSSSNGFGYPPYPMHLPPLGCISERLVAPRLPFMPIRRLRHQMGGYGIVGQDINVPVLPRQLDDDYSFNVRLKRNLIHKSTYLQGCIKKATVKRWLEHI